MYIGYSWPLFSPRLHDKDQEIQQSHTADQPTAPRGRATEHYQSQDTRKTTKAKQPTLSLVKLIAKTRKDTKYMHTQNKDQTQNSHKQWEVHKTMNQQHQNLRLRPDSSLSHWGLKCILLAPNLCPRFCCC